MKVRIVMTALQFGVSVCGGIATGKESGGGVLLKSKYPMGRLSSWFTCRRLGAIIALGWAWRRRMRKCMVVKTATKRRRRMMMSLPLGG